MGIFQEQAGASGIDESLRLFGFNHGDGEKFLDDLVVELTEPIERGVTSRLEPLQSEVVADRPLLVELADRIVGTRCITKDLSPRAEFGG